MGSSNISSPVRNRVRCRQFSVHCVVIQSRTPEGTVTPSSRGFPFSGRPLSRTLLGVSLRSFLSSPVKLTVQSAITHSPKSQGGQGIIYTIAVRNLEGNHTGSGLMGYLQANQSPPVPPPIESACLGSDSFSKSSGVPSSLHEPSPGSPCSTLICFCCRVRIGSDTRARYHLKRQVTLWRITW